MNATTEKLALDFMPKAPIQLLSFVRVPWTLSLFMEWWPKMTAASILRMRGNELRPGSQGQTVTLQMRAPIHGDLTLRAIGSDWSTFEEVVANEVYAGVVQHVAECNTIVDLGANIGLTTRYFASKFPKAKIVAVEPNPDTFRMLQTNLVNTPNAVAIEAAVWSSEAQLDGSSAPDRFSAFEVRENSGGTMRGIPIQQIMELAGGSADILKVDIEGAEVELFKGDLNWLQNVRCIAIEFHGNSRTASNFDSIMDQYGFQVIEGEHTVIALRK